MYSHGIELACQKQKEFVKSSVACKWNLAEAQQKLGSLALHNSESLDQEHAKAQTAVSELKQHEEEWRQKEEALVQRERMCLWNMDAISKDVFNKSFINQDKRKEIEDEDKSKSFMQKYEQKIRHFGMLSRWDDSQRFLSDHPYLVCEETAKYLILWCFHLEAEQKGALMEQIAHQAVVMQFIMEMAKNCNVDPRGCFRLFFQKAKKGDLSGGDCQLGVFHQESCLYYIRHWREFPSCSILFILSSLHNVEKVFASLKHEDASVMEAEEEGYFEAFKNELEAFKSRVRLYSQSPSFQPMTVQNHVPHSGVGSIGSLESLSQNPDYLQYSVNTALCSLNSVVHKEDDESKMMDTV
ncbi:hsp90 co-chaperone Cdc37-like 1 [Prionailurus iriomotensis]